MRHRFRPSVRTLQLEHLHARQLMAADLLHEGAFCPAYESNASLASSTSATSLASTSATAAAPKAKPTYTYSVIGDPLDSTAASTPGLALMGGGTDVDAAFKFMADHAVGGDMVILSTTKHNYGNYINRLGSFNSVASLIVPDVAAAQDSFVYDIISRAEAVFIPGGDQFTYIAAWADTAVEDALYTMLRDGGVLGGTSAGLAVLGDVDYSAALDSTTSAQALSNPRSTSITLDRTLLAADDAPDTILSYLQDTITDSHFMQRDRMGRTLAFMARADNDGLVASSRGIAINEQTALLVEANGAARVVGNPYAKKILPTISNVAST